MLEGRRVASERLDPIGLANERRSKDSAEYGLESHPRQTKGRVFLMSSKAVHANLHRIDALFSFPG